MATLLDLFKSQKKELYGKSDNIRIESRGFINPPRAAALLTSSPNALGDLIGNQIGGALGGSANRPTDTIFRGNSFLSKPISLFKTQSGLRNAVDADTSYYIKQSPAPASFIASLKQGGSSLKGLATNLAIKTITKGGLKKYADSLKVSNDETWGTKYGPKSEKVDGTNILRQDKFFSKYYKNKDGKLIERNSTGNGTAWDEGQKKLLEAISITNEEMAKQEYTNHVIVTFETIPAEGKTSLKVPFVGSITGIGEDVTPMWNSFKYLGSPFNVYRYSGVERSLRFNLKLYYTTAKERDAMIVKMNYLKSLAFPDTDVKAIAFNNINSAYAMAPNLVRITIGSLYKEIPGYIETLGFEIDDNTTWGSFDPFFDDRNEFIYPSVIDVAVGVKIIEDHKIESGSGDTKTYRYDFNGQLGAKDRVNARIAKSLQQLISPKK
jgi:hypothetical protein